MSSMQCNDQRTGNQRAEPQTGVFQRAQVYHQRGIDFSSWQRKTLEQFAQEAHAEIIELRAELRVALDAYRASITGGLK
jgi:hypothetical protein